MQCPEVCWNPATTGWQVCAGIWQRHDGRCVPESGNNDKMAGVCRNPATTTRGWLVCDGIRQQRQEDGRCVPESGNNDKRMAGVCRNPATTTRGWQVCAGIRQQQDGWLV